MMGLYRLFAGIVTYALHSFVGALQWVNLRKKTFTIHYQQLWWTRTSKHWYPLSFLSALPVSGKMVLVILLLSLVLTKTGTDAKSSLGLGDLENLVKQMELKIKDLEAKNKEMETKLEELGKIDSDLEASKSEQKRGAENSSTKEFASSYPHNALTKPSLRDLPIILISAWRGSRIISPQTVTFDSFLANYNNGDTPGGGDGKLDLD